MFIPSRKAYKNLVDMHHELSFHSWLFPEYYIRGNSSVNNNIPKNNKHGQYKCNKNALVLTICQKRSTKAETVNKQNRFRSINYVLSMMSKLIFYHGKWPLHEISTMDIRLQPRVNMSRYISRELLSWTWLFVTPMVSHVPCDVSDAKHDLWQLHMIAC